MILLITYPNLRKSYCSIFSNVLQIAESDNFLNIPVVNVPV